MGDFFGGGSESEAPRILEAFPGQSDILRQLAEAAKPKGLEAISRAGQPYPSPLIAPLSQYQQQGIGGIGNVLNRPMATQSPLFQQGQEAISGALEGFDPFKDLRMKALQTNLQRELKRAKDRIAAKTSASEEYFGGGRIAEGRKLEEKAFGDVSSLAGFLEAESRQRQLQAAPLAAQYAGLAAEEPVSRLQEKLYGIGAAPRMFQQEEITAQQQERQRQLQELTNIGLGTSLQTSMFQPEFYVPSYGPSPFSQLAGSVGAMGGLGNIQKILGELFQGGGPGTLLTPGFALSGGLL